MPHPHQHQASWTNNLETRSPDGDRPDILESVSDKLEAGGLSSVEELQSSGKKSSKQVSGSSSWPERVVCLSIELRVTGLGEELRLTGSSRQLREIHLGGKLRHSLG